METKVNDVVFYGEGFPVLEDLLTGMEDPWKTLAKEMMESGHYTEDGLDVSRFLRPDLSINLEKLELAVQLVVNALESSQEDDATINLIGLSKYYFLRNIEGDDTKKREEKTFLLRFITSIAMEASTRDTLVVKYTNK